MQITTVKKVHLYDTDQKSWIHNVDQVEKTNVEAAMHILVEMNAIRHFLYFRWIHPSWWYVRKASYNSVNYYVWRCKIRSTHKQQIKMLLLWITSMYMETQVHLS